MMQADPMSQPFLDLRSIGTGELEPLKRAGDRRLFLARANINAREILRALRRFQLSKMHNVNRSFALCRQSFERLRQRRLGIRILQRNRPLFGLHRNAWPSVQLRKLLFQERSVAKSR